MTKAFVMCCQGGGEGEGVKGYALPPGRNAALWVASPRFGCAAYHNLTWRSACSYQHCCVADVTYPVSVPVPLPAPPAPPFPPLPLRPYVACCRLAWQRVWQPHVLWLGHGLL